MHLERVLREAHVVRYGGAPAQGLCSTFGPSEGAPFGRPNDDAEGPAGWLPSVSLALGGLANTLFTKA